MSYIMDATGHDPVYDTGTTSYLNGKAYRRWICRDCGVHGVTPLVVGNRYPTGESEYERLEREFAK